ncbi:MAG: hypothetical protein FJ213_02610 [Ignavibacteria bacterium]|nr:hypothetical protein [Ignavibacteria bacterium]
MARLKHVEAFCSYCNKTVKLEIVGELGIESDSRRWARCKTCKHTMALDVEANIKSSANVDLSAIKIEDCKPYNPSSTFEVGDSIYHQDWEDVGKVTAKETTSAGAKSIVVEFEKAGMKKLLEQFQVQ